MTMGNATTHDRDASNRGVRRRGSLGETSPSESGGGGEDRTAGRERSGRGHAQPHRSRLYRDLVPAYEALWPAVAKRRIAAYVESLAIPPGARVLEVGVGTGLSLASYPHHARVTGVDLSEAMLEEAKQRIGTEGWDHIDVDTMDAESLEFDDSSFDFVTSFHTISVVSDPHAMMSEMVRACRPGGEILVINHFRSGNPWIARVVDSAGNFTKRLGWRTDLDIDALVRNMPLRVDDRTKSNPLSLFTVLRATAKPDAVS